MADDAAPVRRTPPAELAPRLGIGRLTHHVLLCDGPSCCEEREGHLAWGQLKRDASRVNATLVDRQVFVTRCDCLKLCDRGPIVVVYPDGVWYERAGADVIRRLIEEHVLGGKPVADHTFAVDALRPSPAGGKVAGHDLSPDRP